MSKARKKPLLVLLTFWLLGMTLSSTWLISLERKHSAESLEECRSLPIERNPLHMLLWWLHRKSILSLKRLELILFILNSELEEELRLSLQDQAPKLPSEPLPDLDSESVELKTLLQSQLILLEEKVVEEVEDYE